MIALFKSPIWICVVLFSGIFSPAMAAGSDRGAELIRIIGMDVALNGFSESVKSSSGGFGANNRALEELQNDLADKHFDGDILMGAMAVLINDRFTDSEYDDITAFLSQGAGLRITEAEKFAQDPANEDLRAAQIDEAVSDLITNRPERMDQIGRMIVAMDMVNSGTALAMNLSYAMMSGMASSGKMPGDFSEDRILGMLESQREMMEQQIIRSTIEEAAFTYRDISDADMDAYIAFLESDLGQKLYNILNAALVDVLTNASRKFGRELIEQSGVREL